MKTHLITLVFTLLFFNTGFAQYFAKQGIYVLHADEYAQGLRYRTTIDFPSNYNENNMDSIVTVLAPELYQLNANTIKIAHRTTIKRKYNKRHTKFKEMLLEVTVAEIYYVNKNDELQPIPRQQYIDSLRNDLIADTNTEALIVIYPSPFLSQVEEFPVITFSFKGKLKCVIDGPVICSYIVTDDSPMHFNLGKKNWFTIYPEYGQVYFLEYLPTPEGNLMPSNFESSYRICKQIQAYNDEVNMMQIPEQ